jgi:hypothetical protein
VVFAVSELGFGVGLSVKERRKAPQKIRKKTTNKSNPPLAGKTTKY